MKAGAKAEVPAKAAPVPVSPETPKDAREEERLRKKAREQKARKEEKLRAGIEGIGKNIEALATRLSEPAVHADYARVKSIGNEISALEKRSAAMAAELENLNNETLQH